MSAIPDTAGFRTPLAPSARYRVALLVILLLAVALRLFRLDAQSLWIDELFTLRNMADPPDGLVRAALRVNNAPPLYYVALWPVYALFGNTEWSLRLVSALAGVVGVALMHRVALRLFGCERTALMAALLLAVNPLHIWFSQEARNYTLVLSVMLGACAVYGRAVERNRPGDWLALGVLTLASAGIAAQGLLILPVLLAWTFLTPPPARCRRGLILSLGIGGVLATALTVVVLLQNGRPPPPRPFTGSELAYTAYCYATGFSFGPSIQELQTLPLAQALRAHVTQATVGALLVALTGLAWLRVGWRAAARPLMWLLAGIGFAVAIHVATPHSYNVRYALPGLLGFVLLTARAATVPGRTGYGLLAAHLAVALWSTAQWFTLPQYGKEDTRNAVALLLQSAPRTTVVKVAPYYMDEVVDYYLIRTGSPLKAQQLRSPEDVQATATNDVCILVTRPQHIAFRTKLDAALSHAVQDSDWNAATTRSYRVYWGYVSARERSSSDACITTNTEPALCTRAPSAGPR